MHLTLIQKNSAFIVMVPLKYAISKINFQTKGNVYVLNFLAFGLKVVTLLTVLIFYIRLFKILSILQHFMLNLAYVKCFKKTSRYQLDRYKILSKQPNSKFLEVLQTSAFPSKIEREGTR